MSVNIKPSAQTGPQPWTYIRALLGPGMHWGRSRAEMQAAIDRAHKDGQGAAADHLQIISELRDTVNFDAPEKEAPKNSEVPRG